MSKQIIDIGIPESSRVEIADGLSRLLADTYTLYIKGSSPIMVGRLRTPYSAFRSGTSPPV